MEVDPAEHDDYSAINPVLQKQALAPGTNVLNLNKGEIYLVSFAYDPSLAGQSGGAIETIGALHLATTGLHSLPLSSDASETLDLGTLEPDSVAASYNSGLSQSDTAAGLGYDIETLKAFASFDGMLPKRILNPDINANGVMDQDEDLSWLITALRDVTIQSSDIDANGNLLKTAQSLAGDLSTISLVFWLDKSRFPHPATSQASLTLPSGTTWLDSNGSPVTCFTADWDSPSEGPSGKYSQYYFNISAHVANFNPALPGDYALKLGSSTYSFKSLQFSGTSAATNEGMILPVSSFAFNQAGVLATISWHWVKLAGGTFVPASAEEVSLRVLQFYYYLSEQPLVIVVVPANQASKSGSLDVLSYGHTKASFQSGNGAMLYCDYWDRAGTDYKFTNRLP